MRLLRLIPCTHSLRPMSWSEDLLLKGYVTWSTKHTADKGGSTILNHAIKMEIKGSKALLEFSQGCSLSVFLSRLSSCLWALAVPAGLVTPLSILPLAWSSLILHERFSTSSFAYAASVVGLCYFSRCECQTQSLPCWAGTLQPRLTQSLTLFWIFEMGSCCEDLAVLKLVVFLPQPP